jgi:hypothetical protein
MTLRAIGQQPPYLYVAPGVSWTQPGRNRSNLKHQISSDPKLQIPVRHITITGDEGLELGACDFLAIGFWCLGFDQGHFTAISPYGKPGTAANPAAS